MRKALALPADRLTGLAAVPAWLADLAGWRRLAAVFLLGLLSALAQPPYGLVPVLLLAVPGLLWLLAGVRRDGAALLLGWTFAFGQLLLGLYWVGHAFLVEAERFAWLLPFAVSLLPAGLALFTAAAVWLTWRLVPAGAWRGLALAGALTLAEWAKAHVLTGFPWALTGYAWDVSLPMLQSAALFGVYGLGALTLFAAAAPAMLWPGRGARRGGRPLAAVALLALAACWIGGSWRLAGAEDAARELLRVRIVQPHIPQAEKWHPEARRRHFLRHLALTREAAAGRNPDVVIWPEAATPFLLAEAPEARQRIGESLPQGTPLIAGTPRQEHDPQGRPQFFNGLLVLDSAGAVRASYDKHHLVPFGEFVPLRWLLSRLGIERLAQGQGDFAVGPGPRVLEAAGLPPFQPLICYEAIFPHEVAPQTRPRWLVNITNDAWFGTSAGPPQHLAAARTRAVEQGLPLARAANTGISAAFDGHGRRLAHLPLGESGILDVSLPPPLAPTPYARLGDVLPVGGAVLMLLAAGLAARRQRAG